MNKEEIEKVTPKNYIIKIRPEKMTFSIFKNNQPEVFYSSSGSGTIINKITHVIFFGETFILNHFDKDINYVGNIKGRMIIPYKHKFTNEIKNITLASQSNCDLMPVVVKQFDVLSDLNNYLRNSNQKNILVVNEDIDRRELINIKLHFQKLLIYIIKNKLIQNEKSINPLQEEVQDKEVVDYSKIRAKDTINETNINVLSKNPVFLSRIHLRNLDIDKVKQILFDFQLQDEDCIFIATFLNTMLNKENDSEINKVKPQLSILKSAFEIYPHVFSMDTEYMEKILDKKMDKELASIVWMLILSAKDTNREKENEIIFWEWENAIKKHLN